MSSELPIWRRPRAQLLALTTLLWTLVLTVAAASTQVLLPFVLAGLAAYVIDPVIVRLSGVALDGRRMPRWVAVLLVYIALAMLVWLGAVSIVPQVYREGLRALLELRDFLASVSPDRIDAWAQEIDAFLQQYGIPVDVVPGSGRTGARLSVDLAAGIADALRNASAALRGQVGDVVAFSRALLSGAVKTIFFVVLLFMVTAFVSMDAPRIVGFFETLVPVAWRADFRRLVHGIDAGLAGVVRGQLTIMMVNGLLTLVGLLVLRIPFAFALAALATVLYVVPIFGTILSSVPIVLLALAAGGFSKGLLALAWILAIHALETYVLNPKILGDAARIHPVLIVLALLLGERTFGLVGALLAVPVMSVFIAVFRFLHRKLAELDERATFQPGANEAPGPAAPERPLEKGTAR
jgi:predicted PurR-regulated permease PerM